MASQVRMDLSIPVSEATFKARTRLMNSDSRRSFNSLGMYMHAMAGNPYIGAMHMVTGAVQATGLITSTGIATAADTVTVGNVELTAVASGAVPADGEWNISADEAVQAASIAAAVNAVAALSGVVTATSNLGVVTLTVVAPGAIGNGVQLSEDADNVAITAFASGADGTTYDFANGYTA